MDNCPFCDIAAGKLPSTIVYQDDDVVAFRDIHPQAPHHILFIPKKHIASSVDDLKPEDGPVLINIFLAAQHVARDLGLVRGYRFITNIGPDAQQSVQHLHFHLLGGQQMEWHPA
jgi:histidine triad (HIT) family protein